MAPATLVMALTSLGHNDAISDWQAFFFGRMIVPQEIPPCFTTHLDDWQPLYQ